MPPRHVLAKHQLTREELIEVAARFLSNTDRYDEKNQKWWQALFDANVRAPAGHVEYERTVARTRMPTPEEVTDAALSPTSPSNWALPASNSEYLERTACKS